MPTIHMDIEPVKAALDLMTKDETEIREILKTLTDAVAAIHGGDWEGKAEEDFQNQYKELNSRLQNQTDSMEALAERLRREIAEWEAMAAKLA
ncbi:MAG: WXG100 family type VII secretion target [Anaerolineales bacterium]|nr:WXG100 family type VII secretion target [Anaerolineales bacterium]